MRVIPQTLSQLQCTSSSLRYVNCGSGHIQGNYSSADIAFNILQNLPLLLLEICRYLDDRYTANFEPNTAHILRLRYVNCAPGHIQCIYSSAYSDFNIHLNVSALLYEISRQFNASYTASLVPNTAHILRFTLCELLSQAYTMHLQLRIFRLHYSSQGRSPAIGGISSIQWALYCKVGANYSAHPTVYAMWTVVPDLYNVFTAPHIQASIFYWTYLCCYWRYADIWMPVILQTLSPIQRISSRLRYVNCGPAYIQSIYSSAYLGFNIQLQVYAL
jgi:hypothetical protein